MQRLRFLALALLVSCARPQACPTIDTNALADAVAERFFARLAEMSREAPDTEGEAGDEEDRRESDRLRVPIEGRPALGSTDARITIVEFTDFECPFCARVQPTLAQIREQYGDQVRFVYRNLPLPFHPHARAAAEAAMEAYAQGGDRAFWAMHDRLFENQRAIAREDLERYAADMGLDIARFRTALDDHAHQAEIDEDLELANRIGAQGTPSFFINGHALVGAVPFARFRTMIDEELEAANALVTGGLAPRDVYATLMRDARSAAPPPEPEPSTAPVRRPDPARTYRIEIPDGRPQDGRADALVTIVEFADFQCPFCGRVQATLDTLRARYGSDLRIVFLHNPLPFHPNAMPAAEAAAEAYAQRGNAAFWEMRRLLFENQSDLSRERLEDLAHEVHLDATRFRRALDSESHRTLIEADQALARRFAANGTPNFFVNGRFLGGAQPIERFAALVDEELSRARALVRAGTRRRDVYARTIEHGDSEVAIARTDGAQDSVYTLDPPARPIVRGPANAPVTLEVFSDFQCPFCARVESTFTRLREHYGDRIRIVWRDYPLPFHENAAAAANAAREVFVELGADAFWQYHDALFANQSDLSRETLERLASGIRGIDMARFRSALDTDKHAAAIRADASALEHAGISSIGTPTTFVNGRMVSGAETFEVFSAAIDRALAERSR